MIFSRDTSNLGWVVDYDILSSIQSELTSEGIDVSLEAIEAVILVIVKMGYAKLAR